MDSCLAFLQTRGRLESGSGQKAFLPELSSPFPDLHFQGSTHWGQTKGRKIDMKSQNLIHILMAIVCFALSPQMQALSPPPDGGYPNGNTAEGDSALSGLTGGFYNSAFGFLSLLSNGSASFNTGVGAGTLLVNTAIANTAVGAGTLGTVVLGLQNVGMGTQALGLSGGPGGSAANVAIGFQAEAFDEGLFNTVVGYSSGQNLTAGFENIYIGDTIGTFSP